jgi:hypothetical protein
MDAHVCLACRQRGRRIADPRDAGRKTHLLIDIIAMAICSVIGNCDDWPGITLIARGRESWFKRFLKRPVPRPAGTFPAGLKECDTDWRVCQAPLPAVRFAHSPGGWWVRPRPPT